MTVNCLQCHFRWHVSTTKLTAFKTSDTTTLLEFLMSSIRLTISQSDYQEGGFWEWFSKKENPHTTHSYTWLYKMLTYSFSVLWFYVSVHILFAICTQSLQMNDTFFFQRGFLNYLSKYKYAHWQENKKKRTIHIPIEKKCMSTLFWC